MMEPETRLEAQRRVTTANRASKIWTRRTPDSRPATTRTPTRSEPKSSPPVGTDGVFKHPSSSAVIVAAPRDAAVSALLALMHRDDTVTLGEEGIDSRDQYQTPYLEDLLRQSLIIQRALTDRMTSVDTAVENCNEATRTRNLEDAVLKTVQTSTKNSAEAKGTTLTTITKR